MQALAGSNPASSATLTRRPTRLRFAEAVGRLDIPQDKPGLTEVFGKENTAKDVTKGVLEGVGRLTP